MIHIGDVSGLLSAQEQAHRPLRYNNRPSRFGGNDP